MRSNNEVCKETMAIRDLIFSEIERVFYIDVADLHTKTRENRVIDVRNAVLVVLRETIQKDDDLYPPPTYFYYTALFAKNDGSDVDDVLCHSTIINALRRYDELRDTKQFVAIRNKVINKMDISRIICMIVDHRKVKYPKL